MKILAAPQARPILAGLLMLAATTPAAAQTLFTYGNHAVGKAEFLKAYQKNNSDSNAPKLSYASYLDLYAKFRIKVQAALDQQLDTTAQQRSEVKAFRDQLAEGFLKDDASIRLLVNEAAARSLRDIHLTSVYLPVDAAATPGQWDSAAKQINAIYDRLRKGGTVDKLAAPYQFVDLGFVTTFELPYEVENAAYTTPIGKYSKPVRTGHGFHILRPVSQRQALGKIRVAQILLAYPPNADDAARKAVQDRADSVYRVLQAGASFAQLALQLSSDNFSYQTGGELPLFGVGKFDPIFEQAAFSLAHDSDITKPFATSFGYHILKRLQRVPVTEDLNNKEWRAALREQVQQSDRMKTADAMLLQNIRRLIRKDAPAAAQSNDTLALSYYRDHLERYNPEFGSQLKEFSEGNLLFNIMQRNVWDPSTTDTTALRQFYDENKSKYWWENSADALIITCPNKSEVEGARRDVKTNLGDWRKWAVSSNGLIQADSGRYELGQIPVAERTNFTEGLITAALVNAQDNSASFAYIIRLYRDREPKKFDEAKGAVINDYQYYLESKWMEKLLQQYPLRVDTKTMAGLERR